jgi:hypothetical protein
MFPLGSNYYRSIYTYSRSSWFSLKALGSRLPVICSFYLVLLLVIKFQRMRRNNQNIEDRYRFDLVDKILNIHQDAVDDIETEKQKSIFAMH